MFIIVLRFAIFHDQFEASVNIYRDSDEKELVEIFYDHYINIVENTLGKKPISLGNPTDPTKDNETVLLIIDKYKDNPIIKTIKENAQNISFSFPEITRPEITKIIKELDTSKSTGQDQIPAIPKIGPQDRTGPGKSPEATIK